MFHNLPFFIGFGNQQIKSQYNKQMNDVKTKLQGMQKQTTNVDKLVFSAIKQDVLAVLIPTSKILQENGLILPNLITICKSAIQNIKKLKRLVEENGSDVFQNVKIFPNCSSFIKELITDEAQRLPERQTRGDSYFSNSQKKVTVMF